MNDHDYTVESARAAAEQDQLAEWVARFLASPGSDNKELGEMLTEDERWWIGPMEVPIKKLHRLAGPADHPVLCPIDDDDWRDDIPELEEQVEEGWEPPPVIVTFRDDQLVLEDGNHRVEGMRRAGVTDAWSIIGFETREDRDRFAAALEV